MRVCAIIEVVWGTHEKRAQKHNYTVSSTRIITFFIIRGDLFAGSGTANRDELSHKWSKQMVYVRARTRARQYVTVFNCCLLNKIDV